MHIPRRWNRVALLLIAGFAGSLPMGDSIAQPKNGKTPVRAKPANRESREALKGQGITLTPAVFLIRDPVVLEELNLTASQRASLAELALAANEEAWKFRDVTPDSAAASAAIQKLNDETDARMGNVLTARQLERLQQIVLQVHGPPALQSLHVAEKLALSATQRGRIASIVAESKNALSEVRARARAGEDRAALSRQVGELQSGLNDDLLAMLAPQQREQWSVLLGKPLDLARLQPLLAKAPELRGIDAWLNSEPLTLAGLRGQVVALHFWTFG
jgi:hypothetical protein